MPRRNSVTIDDRGSVFREDRLRDRELKINFENHGGGFNRGMENALIRETAATYGVGVVRSRSRQSGVTVMSGDRQHLGAAIRNDVIRFGGRVRRLGEAFMGFMRRRRLQAGIIGDRIEQGHSLGHTSRRHHTAAVTNLGHTAIRTGVHEIGHAMGLDHPVNQNFPNIMQPTHTGFQRYQSTQHQQLTVKRFIARRGRSQSQ